MSRRLCRSACDWAPLRRRLTSEDGIAVPIAVTMLFLTLALALAATQVAVSSNDGAERDSKVKRAVQAADAGVEAASSRMVSFSEATTSLIGGDICPVHLTDGSVQFASLAADGWCSPVEEELGNGESYSYRVSGYVDTDGLNSTLERRVVSTGTVDGVTRRVVTDLSADDPRWMLSEYAVVSDQNLILENNTSIGEGPDVVGNARSNGSIELSNSADISGSATPGPGGSVTLKNSSSVGGSTAPASEEIELPAPRMKDGYPNDNGNICSAAAGVSCAGVGYSWNPDTRDLSVSSGELVLVGNVFSFCSLAMSNTGQIEFQPTDPEEPIRVYIGALPPEEPDLPEGDGCAGAPLMSFENNPLMTTTSQEHPIVQFYMEGPGTVKIWNNNKEGIPMALYAPDSTVSFDNNGRVDGGVIADKVTMRSKTAVVPSGSTGALVSIDASPFERAAYRECTTEPTTVVPDSGC